MEMRGDYCSVYPDAIRATGELEKAVHASSLEAELLELVWRAQGRPMTSTGR